MRRRRFSFAPDSCLFTDEEGEAFAHSLPGRIPLARRMGGESRVMTMGSGERVGAKGAPVTAPSEFDRKL